MLHQRKKLIKQQGGIAVTIPMIMSVNDCMPLHVTVQKFHFHCLQKGFKKDGHAPFYWCGYGSYRIQPRCRFQQCTTTLLNRGFVFALAHIRGGEEMGRLVLHSMEN
jgi:hypothetical protein